MQPLAQLQARLAQMADHEHYLFSPSDLRPLFPEHSDGAFRALMSRAAAGGVLERVCRGIYLYPHAPYERGYELFHTAARLRANQFTYISLETALSDLGIISQIPVGRITLMSTGRSTTVNCGRYGYIEFVHTKRSPRDAAPFVVYDNRCRLWRATPQLALRDIRRVGRSLDLINWSSVHEFI